MTKRTQAEQEQYDYFMKLMTKYIYIIQDKDKEIDMLRTMLLDAGVDTDDAEWEGYYQSEESIYNL